MDSSLAIGGVRRPKYFTMYYTRSLQGNCRICQGNLREFSGKKIWASVWEPWYYCHCLLYCTVMFLPEASFGLRVLSLPVSVCVCINHGLVRTITHHSFKLESPNLEQRRKRPWLRCLCFLGWSILTFKVKFNLKVKFYLLLSLSAP